MSREKSRGSARTGLFLIELIVAILFFSIASAICIQLFAKAHIVSTNSKNLTEALTQVQTVAETFKASDGTIENLQELLDNSQSTATDEITLLFNSKWDTSGKDDAKFELKVKIDPKTPATATLSVTTADDKKTPIYNIETKKYVYAEQ